MTKKKQSNSPAEKWNVRRAAVSIPEWQVNPRLFFKSFLATETLAFSQVWSDLRNVCVCEFQEAGLGLMQEAHMSRPFLS